MKKILFSLIVAMMMSNIGFGQESSISDDAYRSKIYQFSYHINTVLLTECPQGIDLNEFKRQIINGDVELSNTAKSSIHNYATPLIDYATDFKAQKNLSTNNSAELYFLSSFSPSTNIVDGKIIEITTKLDPNEMWYCALKSFKTDDNEMKALVSDNSDIQLLSKAATSFLTKYAGDTGVWIMISGFSNCLDEHNNKFSSDNLLSIDDIKAIKENIVNYEALNEINSIESIPENDLNNIMHPLIENGKILHTEIMESLSKMNAFRDLSNEEQEKMLNISDSQAAELSIVLATANSATTDTETNNAENKIPWIAILTCGGAAFGLGSVRQLYNLLAGATIASLELGATLTIIGTIASHYLGIFGVACGVFAFVCCLDEL